MNVKEISDKSHKTHDVNSCLSSRYIGNPIPLSFNDTADTLCRFCIRVLDGFDRSASVHCLNSVYWLTITDGVLFVNCLGRSSLQDAKSDLDKVFNCAYYWEV